MQLSQIAHTVECVNGRGRLTVAGPFANRTAALVFARSAAMAAECKAGDYVTAEECEVRGGKVLLSVGDMQSWLVCPDAMTTDSLPI